MSIEDKDKVLDPKKMTPRELAKEIKRRQGGDKPKKKDSLSTFKMKVRLLDWAQKHNLVICPYGYGQHIENFLEFRACVCDLSRPDCPCPQSLDEIKETGHCLCRLFWRSYKDFMDIQMGVTVENGLYMHPKEPLNIKA